MYSTCVGPESFECHAYFGGLAIHAQLSIFRVQLISHPWRCSSPRYWTFLQKSSFPYNQLQMGFLESHKAFLQVELVLLEGAGDHDHVLQVHKT
jgi:hypothetical protein